jgi:hypothetical protein
MIKWFVFALPEQTVIQSPIRLLLLSCYAPPDGNHFNLSYYGIFGGDLQRNYGIPVGNKTAKLVKACYCILSQQLDSGTIDGIWYLCG